MRKHTAQTEILQIIDIPPPYTCFTGLANLSFMENSRIGFILKLVKMTSNAKLEGYIQTPNEKVVN